MNIVILHPRELDASHAGTIEGERAEHVTKVLGVSAGGSFRVGLVYGALGVATVTAIEDSGAIRIACTFDDEPAVPPRVDLILALPRPKVLARLLSPIAQLGVARLILTGAWKVERFYFDAHILLASEHEPKLIEGLAQAKDTWLPTVSVHRSLSFFLDEELDALVPPATTRIVIDPSATEALESAISRRSSGRIALAIGPEGGFTRRELDHFADRGFAAASLGPRILRSDVATIAALARTHAMLGT